MRFLLPALLLGASLGYGGSVNHAELQRRLDAMKNAIDGRIGTCIQDTAGISCLEADSRFSLQSVMKLPVGVCVMDAVDRRGWRLDEPVVVRREDLSVFVQPIAKLVTAEGYRTNVGDLVRRAIVDSDSAATDILIAKLGGPAKVQECLTRLGVKNMRIDRDERRLQTETVGLEWRAEFVDPAVLNKAIEQVPKARRDEANRTYQKDVRDTSTPRGMANFLHALATGKLLSPASTKHILGVMEQTVTFPDRLKAGAGPGWRVGHKTGSSGTWEGMTVATNDVGVFTAPDGGLVSIAVFIGDSRASSKERSEVMARIAALAVQLYR